MNHKIFSLSVAVLLSAVAFAQTKTNGQLAKPRVIAMTDGEVDDRCSMVRFLFHTNDIELLAIIQTNSVFQRKGWVAEKWLDQQVDAYEKVYPNLRIHDPNYPTPDVLRSKLYVGDNDSTHIVVDVYAGSRIPECVQLSTRLLGKTHRVQTVLSRYSWTKIPGLSTFRAGVAATPLPGPFIN
jgi:hypothetical protein